MPWTSTMRAFGGDVGSSSRVRSWRPSMVMRVFDMSGSDHRPPGEQRSVGENGPEQCGVYSETAGRAVVTLIRVLIRRDAAWHHPVEPEPQRRDTSERRAGPAP